MTDQELSVVYTVETEILMIRDMLKPILDGQIERGHCSPGSRECYGAVPGRRKLTLADARKLVKHATARLDKAAQKLNDL